MSSLFDVPAQLALVLSLAASGAGEAPRPRPVAETAAIASAPSLLDPEPLEGPLRFSEGTGCARSARTPAARRDADYSARIFKTSGGRYYVPAAAERRQILGAHVRMPLSRPRRAGVRADNARRMRAALHRAPTAGDLYHRPRVRTGGGDRLHQAAVARRRMISRPSTSRARAAAPELLPTSGARR